MISCSKKSGRDKEERARKRRSKALGSVIRHLVRRGEVKRISELIYEETQGVLEIFLENSIRKSVTYMEHTWRKTVTAMYFVYCYAASVHGHARACPIC
ncbi:unnamed protein product [Linum tenue]|uniref:Histone H4 n=1 Tax=Linum tenue TaxID=586396 RepID=A0AAV0QW17_9ROSI|nr:unnamed protein product [Linum tenue]